MAEIIGGGLVPSLTISRMIGALLLESGGFLLLESGGYLLLK